MVSDKLKIPWRAGMRISAESLTKVDVISSLFSSFGPVTIRPTI